MAESYKTAFVGGIIGAVATALVGGGVAFLAYIGNTSTDFFTNHAAGAVLGHLRVRLKEGGTMNGSDFDAKCDGNEIPVGGMCMIVAENGVLQNAGTTADGYACTYSRRADQSVKAKIFAACLGRK